MAINAKKYIERALKIRNKEGKVIPLILNAPQRKLYDALAAQHKAGRPMRAIVLKARQMGFSTLTEGLIFERTATRHNVRSVVVAHVEDSTAKIFEMTRLFYNELPQPLRPQLQARNAQELRFDTPDGAGLNSSIRCMTAGGRGIGRGDTVQNLHLSEFAFWPGDKKRTLAGLMQAVPGNPGTMVVIESTANGFDYFKELWDAAKRGENDFVPVFCGWWEMADYRRAPGPGFVLTGEERELAALYGLDDAQLAWRRWCIANNCGGDLELFHQEYPACPEEAFLSTGSCIFDKTALTAQLARRIQPMVRGDFAYTGDGYDFRMRGFVEDSRGAVAIYEQPRSGVPYVIGADTAGEGSDWFVAQVLDNTTGAQVAVLRQQADEDAFTRQLVCLGYYYNTALIAIEANFSTFPIKEAERLGYPYQFTREVEDSYTHRRQKKYGFRTTSVTRPLAIAELVRAAREAPQLIRDSQTLREMLTFVKNERGRPEAMAGEHDDCVMALAIAQYARPQQRTVAGDAGTMQEEPVDEFERQVQDFLNF